MNIIIIPYRKREKHLKYFIENTVPLLRKYMLFRLVIIEQVEGKPFNRGKLLNIGYDIFKELGDNFYTHDVDINPLEETIKEIYTKEVKKDEIMGIFNSKHDTLGGIIKFKKEVYKKINGFPNNYWGWGVEDKSLQNRAEYNKVKITKNITTDDPNRKKYFLRFDDINDRERVDEHKKWYLEYKLFKTLSEEEKLKVINRSGLCNLNYKKMKEEKLEENIYKILVYI